MNPSPPEPAFIPPTPEELAPLFPAYDVQGFIAAGGMGAVYYARQRSLDRPVAIKILPREFGADAQFRACFEAEAKAMARLNHPNLIGVYDFGDIAGLLFIIMEFVSGKSLHYSSHGIAIEQKEAARVVSGICRGLAHAHQAGILHRDIKPANILLTLEAQPKIGDFGLARPVGQSQGANEVIFGTPGYSAPEILKHPERVDERADIYAVGVILYELLTGALPSAQWQPPSTHPAVDPGFDKIVRRATHPSPEMRYADANELGDELDELAKKLQGGVLRKAVAAPAAARSTGPVTRPVGTQARRALSTTKSSSGPLVAVVVFLLIGLAVLSVVIMGGGNEPRTIQAPRPVPATPSPNPLLPDQTKPAFVSTPREREPRHERDLPWRPDRREDRDPEPDPEKIAKKETTLPVTPLPEPEPEPETPPKPAYPPFDTTAYIDTGRTAMQTKADYIFSQYEEDLVTNIDRFQRAAERVVRRLDNSWRDPAEEFVDSYFEKTREANRIDEAAPEEFPRALEDVASDFKSEYAEALAQQQSIDKELENTLIPLRDAYFSGLKKKAAELRELGNTDGETILIKEADKTIASMPRFIAILKREDPDPPVTDEEEEDDDQDKKDGKD